MKEEATGEVNAPETPVMGRGDEYEGGATNDPPHDDDPDRHKVTIRKRLTFRVTKEKKNLTWNLPTNKLLSLAR